MNPTMASYLGFSRPAEAFSHYGLRIWIHLWARLWRVLIRVRPKYCVSAMPM